MRKLLPILVLAVVVGGGFLAYRQLGPGAPPPASFDELSPEDQQRFRDLLRRVPGRIRDRKWEESEQALAEALSIFEADARPHALRAEIFFSRRQEAMHAEIMSGMEGRVSEQARAGMPEGMFPTDVPDLTEAEEDALVDEALVSALRALELEPDNASALKMLWYIRENPAFRRFDPDAALEAGRKVLESYPDDFEFRSAFVDWLLSGPRFHRKGRNGVSLDSSIGLEIAEETAGWILDRYPADTHFVHQGIYGLGQIHLYMGDFETAVEYLRRLDDVALDPKTEAHILLDRGVAYYRLGRHREAAADFLRSVELESTLQARWLLRLAYEGLGRNPDDLPDGYRFELPPEEYDPASPPQVRFVDVGAEVGVAKLDGAGPSAFADYDGDGDDDILVAGCDTFTALFRNDGERFTDVTIEAGLVGLEAGFSTNLVDYDGDGDLDIYVARQGWTGDAPNILMRNKGDGTFEDASAESGLDDPGCAFVSIWSDFDGDGHLDVFLGQGVLLDGHQNRLYRNRGDGTFEDVTEKAGLLEPRAWGTIGVAVGDYDKDGDPDIFLNGRTMAPNRLYRNRGDGTFEEVAEAAGVTAPQHDGYVAFWVDMDNDAWPDLLTTSLSRWNHVLEAAARESVPRTPADLHKDVPRLFRNDRDGTFTEITFEAGLRSPHGVMGASVGDADNDGFVDIFLGTGDPDIKRLEPSAFYRNRGDGTFVDLTRLSGTGHVGKGHGYSMADFDRDGDLDLYAPQGGFSHGDLWPNPLYRNEAAAGNHWLHVRLVGSGSNPFAVGAQVTLSAGGGTQYREVSAGIGFGSTDSYPVEFGLGASDRVDAIEVRWPGGERQRLEGPPIDALIEVTEGVDGWKVVHRGGRGG